MLMWSGIVHDGIMNVLLFADLALASTFACSSGQSPNSLTCGARMSRWWLMTVLTALLLLLLSSNDPLHDKVTISATYFRTNAARPPALTVIPRPFVIDCSRNYEETSSQD